VADVAGVIETIGESVVSWNPGDQVFYHTTWRKDGSYAEFNVAPAHTFARVPGGISFVDAATLPCAALTAYCALYRRLHVREGDIVLVHAAAGGVGGFAVQLAKAAKAIPKALERLAKGHVRGKMLPECKADSGQRGAQVPRRRRLRRGQRSNC
jgi:NADPH:quinone reductase-like Zn-dependent oxidoreductase